MNNEVHDRLMKDERNQTRFAALLSDLARQLGRMDSTTFEKVLSGEFRVEVRVAEDSKTRRPGKKSQIADKKFVGLRDALRKTETREQAREMIDRALRTKDDLYQLARLLDIPALKNATSEHLKDRLVEATIGFRIRSAAVQGKLKMSSRHTEANRLDAMLGEAGVNPNAPSGNNMSFQYRTVMTEQPPKK